MDDVGQDFKALSALTAQIYWLNRFRVTKECPKFLTIAIYNKHVDNLLQNLHSTITSISMDVFILPNIIISKLLSSPDK